MSRKLISRAVTVGVAAVASLALGATPAYAHFCYKTNMNPQAIDRIAGSANWMSFADLAALFEPDLCAEGVAILADAGGVTTSTMIHTHGTMAGGTLKKGPDAGTKSISYIDFEGLFAARPAAYEACGLPVPEPEE